MANNQDQRDDDLDDDVDMTPEAQRLADEEEKRRAAKTDDNEADIAETNNASAMDDVPEGDDDDSAAEQDDDPDDDDGGEDETAAAPAKDKKKQGARERIEELARARRDAEREAFEAQLELQRLKSGQGGQTGAAAKELPKEPKAEDFTYGEVDPDYLEARVEYRVAQKMAETESVWTERQREEEERRTADKYRARLKEVMAEGEKKHADFKDVVESTPFPPNLARAILDSEQAVDIAHYLGNNLGDLRKLAQASEAEQLRTLGRLEGQFSAASAGRKKKSRAPEAMGVGRKKRKPSNDEAQYGPTDQDEFDKAFFGWR